MNINNEKEINDKIRQLAVLIPLDLMDTISKYVGWKLTMMRRDFISGLTIEDLRYWCKSYDKVPKIFDESTIYKLLAQFDMKIIESKFILFETSQFLKMQKEGNFTNRMADAIIKSFEEEVVIKHINT